MDGSVPREQVDPAPVKELPQVPEAEISETQKKQAEVALIQAELALKADAASELLITDPRKFEELLLSGDLDEDEPEPVEG